MPLVPQQSISFIEKSGVTVLTETHISPLSVGEKAFGLSCLPAAWTLPFAVVSSELYSEYLATTPEDRLQVIFAWSHKIVSGLSSLYFSPQKSVWVRSSGVSETIADRGRLHSECCTLDVPAIAGAIKICLQHASKEAEPTGELFLIFQEAVLPVSAKGHLSNERQHFEEARDWLGQIEEPLHSSPNFQISLRDWRKKSASLTQGNALSCSVVASISQALKPAAAWAAGQNLRIHFEWVWDGRTVFIVQADEAAPVEGFDPRKQLKCYRKHSSERPKLKCLQEISSSHAKRFSKINNVAIYKSLELPSCPIFVLDDESVFKRLLEGEPPADLIYDLRCLCEFSLVVRTDIETNDKRKRQLLPRTCELRDPHEALKFMKETLAVFEKDCVKESVAFIFHNFIPATSSAFAYAEPNSRKVYIESLWGLPEGLYYNSHDSISVDTKKTNATDFTAEEKFRFDFKYKPRYKGFCVAPNSKGEWTRERLGDDFNWSKSISSADCIKEIAAQSRRIANVVGEPVSVMWFIGVPKRFSSASTFPWHHEPYSAPEINKNTRRAKTPFDKTLVIETKEDVRRLEAAAEDRHNQIRQIRLQPKENDLLRNKALLETVGALAVKADAVIFLEGGTLSHAYYQLVQTNAQVDIAEPFEPEKEVQQFNKLVRNGIPSKISNGGEIVRVSHLDGDNYLHALKEKLVEEAVEVLDAFGHDRILEELADVEEVVDAILAKLGATKKQLLAVQKRKRAAVGGFEDGVVLLETKNPSVQQNSAEDLFREIDAPSAGGIVQTSQSQREAIIRRWGDKREYLDGTQQRILKFSVGLAQDSWFTDTRELMVDEKVGASVRAKITGKRKGSSIDIEVSVYALAIQGKLFDS